MIPIIYTDSDSVLGIIGLSSEDISDTFIQTKNLPTVLSVDLYTWLPTHADIQAKNNATGSTEQDHFNFNCLMLYCIYFCAVKVLEGGLGVMSRETDGQNEYTRLNSINITQLVQEAKHQAGYYRETLLSALSASNVATRVPQATLVTSTYDPITG